MTPEILILYNDEQHSYTVNGRPTRYWSQIALDAGLAEPLPETAWVIEAKHRGTQIHDVCALILERRTVDTSQIAEEALPYIMAFTSFLEAHNIGARVVESPLYNADLDYCCTPDWYTPRRVYELKTTAKPSRLWGLQTAAQALAHGSAISRVIVWLRPKLKTKQYEVHVSDNGDRRIFSDLDFKVVEAACRGDYGAKCIEQWKEGL